MEPYLVDYQNPQQVKRDIKSVLDKYGGLKLAREPCRLMDGSNRQYTHLQGTIPVLYKGSTYNIPIGISLAFNHPYQAPFCTVRPTPTMKIVSSPNVNANGQITLKYLQNWKPNNDLLNLIKVMRSKFGEIPPLTSTSSATAETYSPYPVYPKPPEQNIPPYPTSFPTEPYNNFGYPYPQPQPQPQPQQQSNLPYPTTSYPNTPYNYYGGYPATADTNTNTVTEEHIRLSILSAVEHKLKKRLKEYYSQNEAEVDTLVKTQQELNDGSNQLEKILSGLKLEDSELAKNISIIKEKEEEVDEKTTQFSGNEVDPDEAVVTTAPLYNQLLNAYAEESTAEDAIYYMGEALRTGVIDLDVFLKQVRALSRKQFTLRALMQKCRQKAGLAF